MVCEASQPNSYHFTRKGAAENSAGEAQPNRHAKPNRHAEATPLENIPLQ